MITKIKDLVGTEPIRGDIRIRIKGNVCYPIQYPTPVIITLTKVYWKKIKNIKWLYWEWNHVEYKKATNCKHECNYGGQAGQLVNELELDIIV